MLQISISMLLTYNSKNVCLKFCFWKKYPILFTHKKRGFSWNSFVCVIQLRNCCVMLSWKSWWWSHTHTFDMHENIHDMISIFWTIESKKNVFFLCSNFPSRRIFWKWMIFLFKHLLRLLNQAIQTIVLIQG